MRRVLLVVAIVMVAAWYPAGARGQTPPVQFSVTTDRVAYTMGAPLLFTVTVTNLGTEAVTLTFPSGSIFDLTVTSVGRTPLPVWRLSEGRFVTQAVTSRTIAAGDRLVLPAQWDQRTRLDVNTPSGVYTVTATLMIAGRPLSAPATFVLGELQTLPGPGCLYYQSVFPDGTPIELVLSVIDPRENVEALWRMDLSRWQAWSPIADAPVDLQVVNYLDLLRICVTATARWITPFR